MKFRQLALIFAIALLAAFTLKAQTAGNGQGGYWPTTGQTHEKLYVNSGEGDVNNLTIIDVKTSSGAVGPNSRNAANTSRARSAE